MTWQEIIEDVLHEVPDYNPWDNPGDAYLDHEAAAKAINFFAERLKHVEGSAKGDPFILKRWQAAIVGNLFGWKRKDDAGRIVRRYRVSLIFVPRGNGKTPLSAGIVLYAFFEDREPGAQCYLAAGQKEQAGYLFRNAKGMVEQDPELYGAVKIYAGDQHRSIILIGDPMSFCKTIPADAAGQHGGIPHITVVDELHVQESRDLLDVFETGMAKKVRAQPLLVMITTSDYERQSVCNEQYDYACKVRDNGGDPEKPGHDPSFFPVIYETLPDDDWRDERVWHKANPNLGVSVSLESFRKLFHKAQEVPAFENTFKRLHLNMRTGQDMRFFPMGKWDACPKSVPDLSGRRCYAGLDLASTEDLASLCLAFPLEDEACAVLSFSWCPEERIKSRARQRVPYDAWAKAGHMDATAGDQIDYREIRRKINELQGLYEIVEMAYDPHGATHLIQDLQDTDGLTVVMVRQSFGSLAGPTKEVLRRVKLGKILHGGNPVLRWAVSNAAVHFDGRIPVGQRIDEHIDKVPVMLSKRKSGDKIDPAAAMVLAFVSMLDHPQDSGGSVYESRGVLII